MVNLINYTTEDINKRFNTILEEVKKIKSSSLVSNWTKECIERIEIACNIKDNNWDKEKSEENDDDYENDDFTYYFF